MYDAIMEDRVFDMNQEEYLKNRVDNQIHWYSIKSSKYKKCFYIIRTVEIILASAITIISAGSYFTNTPILIPIFSLSIVIILSLLALYKFQELWLSYRTTSECLKYEKYLFITNTSPYDTENKFNLLVKNIENMISSENRLWKQKIDAKER